MRHHPLVVFALEQAGLKLPEKIIDSIWLGEIYIHNRLIISRLYRGCFTDLHRGIDQFPTYRKYEC